MRAFVLCCTPALPVIVQHKWNAEQHGGMWNGFVQLAGHCHGVPSLMPIEACGAWCLFCGGAGSICDDSSGCWSACSPLPGKMVCCLLGACLLLGPGGTPGPAASIETMRRDSWPSASTGWCCALSAGKLPHWRPGRLAKEFVG